MILSPTLNIYYTAAAVIFCCLFTLDVTDSSLAGKGPWNLLHATPAMISTTTKDIVHTCISVFGISDVANRLAYKRPH